MDNPIFTSYGWRLFIGNSLRSTPKIRWVRKFIRDAFKTAGLQNFQTGESSRSIFTKVSGVICNNNALGWVKIWMQKKTYQQKIAWQIGWEMASFYFFNKFKQKCKISVYLETISLLLSISLLFYFRSLYSAVLSAFFSHSRVCVLKFNIL